MKPYSTLAAGIALLMLACTAPGAALAADAAAAYSEIKETYGDVPGFFRLFPADGVAEAWSAFTELQMNPETGLDAKTRELIGVAVAAQGDCRPCLYFHAAAASANGAAETEIMAAAALVTSSRRLHTAFKRADAEPAVFARETDLVLWGDPETAERRRPTVDVSCLRLESTVACD